MKKFILLSVGLLSVAQCYCSSVDESTSSFIQDTIKSGSVSSALNKNTNYFIQGSVGKGSLKSALNNKKNRAIISQVSRPLQDTSQNKENVTSINRQIDSSNRADAIDMHDVTSQEGKLIKVIKTEPASEKDINYGDIYPTDDAINMIDMSKEVYSDSNAAIEHDAYPNYDDIHAENDAKIDHVDMEVHPAKLKAVENLNNARKAQKQDVEMQEAEVEYDKEAVVAALEKSIYLSREAKKIFMVAYPPQGA